MLIVIILLIVVFKMVFRWDFFVDFLVSSKWKCIILLNILIKVVSNMVVNEMLIVIKISCDVWIFLDSRGDVVINWVVVIFM